MERATEFRQGAITYFQMCSSQFRSRSRAHGTFSSSSLPMGNEVCGQARFEDGMALRLQVAGQRCVLSDSVSQLSLAPPEPGRGPVASRVSLYISPPRSRVAGFAGVCRGPASEVYALGYCTWLLYHPPSAYGL